MLKDFESAPNLGKYRNSKEAKAFMSVNMGSARQRQKTLYAQGSQLRGGLRPWSQTMVLEGARPWGRGRSEFAHHGSSIYN